jgi:hypothetical protein
MAKIIEKKTKIKTMKYIIGINTHTDLFKQAFLQQEQQKKSQQFSLQCFTHEAMEKYIANIIIIINKIKKKTYFPVYQIYLKIYFEL